MKQFKYQCGNVFNSFNIKNKTFKRVFGIIFELMTTLMFIYVRPILNIEIYNVT